ncbi:MAG: ABC transporter ATP-binding protein, partial [Pseudomonadota bacterium]
TKRYGKIWALKNISFTVAEGEIMGFIGPNGAGKTTTMKILSCFMPATSGNVSISGYDVFHQAHEVKKIIGFLPEQPPLYDDMTVNGYLEYVSQLKGIPRLRRKILMNRALKICGLENVQNRLIKNLSKGYRQRVGIAQAIIHEPRVLILDEPTASLDPRQTIEVRELIKKLSGEHTVILSTHILPEMAQTCQKVAIINEGEIIGADTYPKLSSQLWHLDRTKIRFSHSVDQSINQDIEKIPGVISIETDAHNSGGVLIETEPEETKGVVSKIIEMGAQKNWGIREISPQEHTLEEVFVGLIQRHENKTMISKVNSA